MRYEYSDRAGDMLAVKRSGFDVGIIIRTHGGEKRDCVGVYAESHHAPALALAILEAAGYGEAEAVASVKALVARLEHQDNMGARLIYKEQ